METIAPAIGAPKPPKKRTRRQRIQALDQQRAILFYRKYPYLKRKDPLVGPSGMTEDEQLELAMKESRKLSRKRSRVSSESDFDSAEELRRLEEPRLLKLAAHRRTRRYSPPGKRAEFPPTAFASSSRAHRPTEGTFTRVEDFKRPGGHWATGYNPARPEVSHYGQPIPDFEYLTGSKRRVAQICSRNLQWLSQNMEAVHAQAKENLRRSGEGKPTKRRGELLLSVANQEWGACALEMTRTHGTIFAVLNVANERNFGGYYTKPGDAQEENMFRRTDCHFHDEGVLDVVPKYKYSEEMRALVNGSRGVVYFDKQPRVCAFNENYDQYDPNDYFLFYELRSAPEDNSINPANGRVWHNFKPDLCRQKIVAQLETLMKNNESHVVLSAFGCEKFGANPRTVARIYAEEIQRRRDQFSVVTFAIPAPVLCATFASILTH